MEDELLHVDGHTFDPDDLTFGEKRAVRRLIRHELWSDDDDGEFTWDAIGADEVIPATVTVFMRRENPGYLLEQALALRPGDVMPQDAVPPTKASPARASARKKTSAASGGQTSP